MMGNRILVLDAKDGNYKHGLYNPGPISGDSGKHYRIISANIRTPTFIGDNWALHNDAEHEPVGISNVSVGSEGELLLTNSFTAKKVISLTVTPHVSTAKKGYRTATTGGLTTHAIHFWRDVSVSGRVMWNGSGWILDQTGVSSDDINLSVTDFGNGIVEVWHSGIFDMSMIPNLTANGHSGLIPYVDSWAENVIRIGFKNYNGDLVTSPDTRCICLFTRGGTLKVPAAELVEPSGSFWVNGLFLV